MIRLDGVDYCTPTEAPEQLGGDVTPDMVRQWIYRKLVVGYRVGRETYCKLDDLTEVEYETRISRQGRPRGYALSGSDLLIS